MLAWTVCLSIIFTNLSPFWARTLSPITHPVVLIPGDAGSQLQAKLVGKPEVVHYYCAKVTKDFFSLWLNLELLLPIVIGCWVDNMQLVYNKTTNATANMPGVLIRVPGYGNTSTVEYLDRSKTTPSRYFADIVDALVTGGYRRAKSVVAAPYDWRRAPNEFQEYYANLTKLITNTYTYNGNKKVVILAHSMGNPVMLYFYNKIVTQDWKDKYIHSHIALAGAWAGSMQIIRLLASGYNMNHYRIFLPPSDLRDMQRSFTSSMFLFPNYNVWGPDEVLASVGEKIYTTANVAEFFADIKYEVGWSQYQNTAHLLGSLDAPNVEIHCAYGYGIETPERFSWSHFWFPDYQPSTEYGDGDGTVNKRSLEACRRWVGENGGKQVKLYPMFKAEHMDIMQRADVIELIKQVVFEND